MAHSLASLGEDTNDFLALGIEGESCWSNHWFVHVFADGIEEREASGFFCRGVVGFGRFWSADFLKTNS